MKDSGKYYDEIWKKNCRNFEGIAKILIKICDSFKKIFNKVWRIMFSEILNELKKIGIFCTKFWIKFWENAEKIYGNFERKFRNISRSFKELV